MPPRWILAPLAAALAVVSSAAQQPPIFRAETRLVVLQATVRDRHGALVPNLDRSAFAVYENGKRQPITLFRRDDVPVSIGLVIDNSGSMRTLRAKVEAAALAFARASNPLDELFVVNFADKVHVDVPFTSDVRDLERGISRVDAIGGTALNDALATAQDYLQKGTRDRRVLVVITDGNDNASETRAADVEREAERADTVIYAIGLFGDDPAKLKRGHSQLDRLTERTGGTAYYPSRIDQIDSVVLELAHQIRQQYTIAYAPTNQALDGTWRTIRVVAAGREPLVVHTRAGYRAEKPDNRLLRKTGTGQRWRRDRSAGRLPTESSTSAHARVNHEDWIGRSSDRHCPVRGVLAESSRSVSAFLFVSGTDSRRCARGRQNCRAAGSDICRSAGRGRPERRVAGADICRSAGRGRPERRASGAGSCRPGSFGCHAARRRCARCGKAARECQGARA